MPSQVIKDTFLNIYRDDYADSDNYYKVLFNNGRALQQRELNQMQTIINKDIGALSEYVFKPGAAVTGASSHFQPSANFIKLNTSSSSYALPSNYSALENEVFTESISGYQLRIQKVVPATVTDPATIFVTYLDDNSDTIEDAPTVTPGRVLTGNSSGTTLRVQSTNTVSNPATGVGQLYTINPGRIYLDEHFVYTPLQSIVLSKYSTDTDATIGFKVTESIITASDDQNLYDNSGPSLNIAAPGADRYKVYLELVNKDDVDAGEYFIKLARFQDGNLIEELNSNSAETSNLNEIDTYYAKRHFETHGNFQVAPNVIHIQDGDSDGSFQVRIGAGKAFVGGRYLELKSELALTEIKPRATKTLQNESITATYGNYIIASSIKGTLGYGTFAQVNLRSATAYGGSTVGTARVRHIVAASGGTYRIYLFDVSMSSGQFSGVKSIGTSATVYANIKLSNGAATLYNKEENNLLFPLPRTRPSSISDAVITVQRVVTDTSDGAGDLTISPTTGYTFTDDTLWIITNNSTGAVIYPTITNNSTSADITGLPVSTACSFVTYQRSTGSTATHKAKTLTNRTMSTQTLTTGSLTLNKCDIYDITSITDDTTSLDITSEFTLDNGQRDNYYGQGVITIKPGATQPASTITVVFRYFNHTGAGTYFSKDSYNGQVNYGDIPAHQQTNGQTIELRDVLDFRPTKTIGATSLAEIFALPRQGSTITADIGYYLGVKGKIFAMTNGLFAVYLGQPAFSPKYRDLGDDALEIARLNINPYMIDNNDISIEYVHTKRYTMRDIARLDDRVEDLAKLTAMSLLEAQTANLDVLDSDGFTRLKSGITADNFKDHFQCDIYTDENQTKLNTEYKAAIDPILGEVRPKTITRTNELIFDSDASTNVIKKGDIVLLDYDEIIWQQNTQASRVINVSDLALPKFVGSATISPTSDNWIEEDPDAEEGSNYRLPAKINPSQNRLSVLSGNTYKFHDLNWNGIYEDELQDYAIGKAVGEGETTNSSYKTGGAVTNKGGYQITSAVYKHNVSSTPVYSYAGYDTITNVVSDTVVSQICVPWIRSRFVSFKFTGLRPNTRHFIFMDGVDMSNWVYAIPGVNEFTRMADLEKTSPFLEASQQFSDELEFPAKYGGKTPELITDTNGAISGWLLIPRYTFKCGAKEIFIQDISSVGNRSSALSMAIAIYSAEGKINQYQVKANQYRLYNIKTEANILDIATLVTPERRTYYDYSCFVKGTKVTMADGTRKNIEDVKIGEQLQGQTQVNTVLEYDHPMLNGRDLIGINGNGPFMTPEHPLYVTDGETGEEGWKSYDMEITKVQKPDIAHIMMGSLKVGDKIHTSNGFRLDVNTIEVHSSEPDQQVFNFILDGDNTYYANDLLAHNRGDDGGSSSSSSSSSSSCTAADADAGTCA